MADGTGRRTPGLKGHLFSGVRVARINFSGSPSFKGLSASSSSSSETKKRNRACDTAHEILFRKLLWAAGLRYRKNVARLPGKPDVVFSRQRVAIFCDGDFWHGREWDKLAPKLRDGHNASYWVEKIRANRERDFKTSQTLRELGWVVLRFWESDLKRDPTAALTKVLETLGSQN